MLDLASTLAMGNCIRTWIKPPNVDTVPDEREEEGEGVEHNICLAICHL
jgi:hypothetical protein